MEKEEIIKKYPSYKHLALEEVLNADQNNKLLVLFDIKKKMITSFLKDIDNNNVVELKKMIGWFEGVNLSAEYPSCYKSYYLKYTLNEETLFFLFDHLETLGENFPEIIHRYIKKITQSSVANVNIFQNTLKKYPHLFEKFMKEDVLDNWGKIDFDQDKHRQINQYVIDHHSDLKQVFRKIRDKKSSSYDFLTTSFDDFFNISQYRDSLEKLSQEDFRKFSQECMVKALSEANLDAMYFWISLYVKLPDEKTKWAYASFINYHSRSSSHREALSFVLNNMSSITMANHLMLKTAINIDNSDIALMVLMNYSNEQLQEAKQILNEKKEKDHNKVSIENAIKFIWKKELDQKIDTVATTSNRLSRKL